MIPIETERLLIRPFMEPDRELFHEINSDEKVMEFYPYRRTRAQSDALFDFACAETPRTGYGYTAVEIKASDRSYRKYADTTVKRDFKLKHALDDADTEAFWEYVADIADKALSSAG